MTIEPCSTPSHPLAERSTDPAHVARRVRKAQTLAESALRAGGAAALPRPDVGGVMRCCASTPCARSTPSSERSVVVTIMGAVAAELQALGHRPSFFYLRARHGAGLLDGAGHRAGPARAAGRRARRRRLGADEPRRADHPGALPARQPASTSSSTTRACSRSAASRPPPPPAATWPASPQAAGVPRTATVARSTSSRSRFRDALAAQRADHARGEGRQPRDPGLLTDLPLLENRFQFAAPPAGAGHHAGQRLG